MLVLVVLSILLHWLVVTLVVLVGQVVVLGLRCTYLGPFHLRPVSTTPNPTLKP